MKVFIITLIMFIFASFSNYLKGYLFFLAPHHFKGQVAFPSFFLYSVSAEKNQLSTHRKGVVQLLEEYLRGNDYPLFFEIVVLK